MTIYKRYYLLDNVSETILGNFFAKNDRMAEKILDQFDFKKAHLDKSDVTLAIDLREVPQYETYAEVLGSECCKFTDIVDQKVLEFEE